MDRPIVATYEPDADGVEQLVHRPMNDEEYADHQERAKAAAEAEAAPPVHPLIAAVSSLSPEDRAAFRAVLEA